MIIEIRKYTYQSKFILEISNIKYRSERACPEVIDDLIEQWNKLSARPYKAVTFKSYDKYGQQIYHTDCMMTLLNQHAVVAITCVLDKKERKNLIL